MRFHDAVARFFLYPRYTAAWKRRPGRAVPDLERLPLETPDGPGEALFLRSRTATAERPAPLVCFCHGNGEVADLWTDALALYRDRGAHVLIPEYRGYGRSAGQPTEAALTGDVSDHVAQVLARDDVDGDRLVLHGRSLGGGVACGVARRHPPRALVLQSTFVSVPALTARWGVPRGWNPDVYDNEAVVRALGCPVFVVHGTRDLLIPSSHAERLADAAADAELHLVPGPHDLFPPGRALREDDRDLQALFTLLDPFLRRAGVLRS